SVCYLAGLLFPDAGQTADPGVRDCLYRVQRGLFCYGMYSCVSVCAEDIQAEGLRGKEKTLDRDGGNPVSVHFSNVVFGKSSLRIFILQSDQSYQVCID